MHSHFARSLTLSLVSMASVSLLVTLTYQEAIHTLGRSFPSLSQSIDPDEDDRGSGRLSFDPVNSSLWSFRGSGRIDPDREIARRGWLNPQVTYGIPPSGSRWSETA